MKTDRLPPAECARIFAGENPITVWREYRGLSIEQLADEALLPRKTVQFAEIGARRLTARELRHVASALGVAPIDLGSHRRAYIGCCLAVLDADEDSAERPLAFEPVAGAGVQGKETNHVR